MMKFHFLLFLLFQINTSSGRPINIEESWEDVFDSEERKSLLEWQEPEDVIYDLAGRGTLVTRDQRTEKYLTFRVNVDEAGIPYIIDPPTGQKYLVDHSRIRKGVDLYRLMTDNDGNPVVADWETASVKRIKINKYGEVELSSTDGKADPTKLSLLEFMLNGVKK